MTFRCDGLCSLRFPRGQPSEIFQQYIQSLDRKSYIVVFNGLRRLSSFPCSMLDRMVTPIRVEEEAVIYVHPVQLSTKGNGVISYFFLIFDEYECVLLLLGFGELVPADVFGEYVRGLDSEWVYAVDPEDDRLISLVESKFVMQIRNLYQEVVNSG